jgi:nitric oxide reductase subunit B
MRLPGDVLFGIGAVLMAWDFFIKMGPLLPSFLRWTPRGSATEPAE